MTTSRAAGSTPILSSIPFASAGVAYDAGPSEFSKEKDFALISCKNNATEAHERQKLKTLLTVRTAMLEAKCMKINAGGD